jgi:hypothetical protein
MKHLPHRAPPTTAASCHHRPNPTIPPPKFDHGELHRSPLDLPVPSRQYPGDRSGRRPGFDEALRRPWRRPMVSHPVPGPPLCGLNPPYSLYTNNSVIPWKIQQFYMDTPPHHQFSISVQILNKHQLQPTILHLHPCLLHRSPPNIVYFLICHQIFPNYRFHPRNFNHSYLINRNSESGDSCTKVSESYPLSLQSIPMLMIVAFM